MLGGLTGAARARRCWPGAPSGSGLLPSASRAQEDPTSTFTKIYKRSFCLLQAWVEDCYTVDFAQNSGLLGRLEDFLSSKVTAGQARGRALEGGAPALPGEQQ